MLKKFYVLFLGLIIVFSFPGFAFSIGVPQSRPSNVNATDGSYHDKIRISWDSVLNTTYYEVYRYTSNDSTKAKKNGSVDDPVTYFDDTTAIFGTTYHYWVKACNGVGCTDYSFSSDSGYREADADVRIVDSRLYVINTYKPGNDVDTIPAAFQATRSPVTR